MEKAPVPPLMDYFIDIKDPRVERNKAYLLIEVIVITILAITAFAEAWATNNRLVPAQVKTQDKSNEITAIPSLLELIALKGCIVTIDAM